MESDGARQPETIRRLPAGIPPALALLAGMELGVFTAVADCDGSPEAVAARLGVAPERLERLLRALVVAELLEAADGRYRNVPEADAFLVDRRPRYLGGQHELLAEIWRADFATAASIRTGRPAAAHDFTAADAQAESFLRGLMPEGLAFGRALAAERDLSGCRSAIDIGGGTGTALLGLAERHPAMQLTLLELPATARLAPALLGADAARLRIEAGDIVRAPAAGRHDAALMKSVLQCVGPEEAARAVRHAWASLNPGGGIFITGSGILDDGRLSPPPAVFFDLTFLNLYAAGASYTEAEYRGWLKAAGFVDVRRGAISTGQDLIEARRPG